MKRVMMLVLMFVMVFSVNSYAGKSFFARLCCCCGDDDVVDIGVVNERSPLLNSGFSVVSSEHIPFHSSISTPTVEHTSTPTVVEPEFIVMHASNLDVVPIPVVANSLAVTLDAKIDTTHYVTNSPSNAKPVKKLKIKH